MFTLTDESQAIYREKGSKFIAICTPIRTIRDVDEALSRVRSKYPDASHHCYAWRINPENISEFAQDDGEPSGTAGVPILNRLKSADLVQVLAVVVRYFGGTKLGKGGLIKAYSQSVQEVLNQTTLRNLEIVADFKLKFPYHESKQIEMVLQQFNGTVLESNYDEDVEQIITCGNTFAKGMHEKLLSLQYLGIEVTELGISYRVQKI
jgi:uncharacterized YigZ family protein